MKQVWKYTISIADCFEIEMPMGAEILAVQAQGDEPRLWALVDPDEPTAPKTFRLAGTGHPMEEEAGSRHRYVGTFQILGGALVFHLFELEQATLQELGCGGTEGESDTRRRE